jgi:pSer/pThr/pTyr-binding forkhead associated (FHA) protein
MGFGGGDDPISAGHGMGAPGSGAPGTGAPGTLEIIQGGQSMTRLVYPGERLTVGTAPDSSLVLTDPRVGPRHASIERRGPGWLVRGLDDANPTFLLDATGRAQPIQRELGLRSGVLLIGGVEVRLYSPRP